MVYSPLLSGIPWLRHGFGTRSDDLSQDGMASLRQIHSAVVLPAVQPGLTGEGDALVTGVAGLPVSVRTADCFPILLADSRHLAVAAVHAGWRGTAAGILAVTLHEMRARFGTASADVYAAIGPGIGVCCYEVGREVARQFGMSHRGNLDLAAANRAQLIAAGVAPGRIDVIGQCTKCNARSFHSFRRDGDSAGRMISFAAID